jgi:DMSO/TMAO reductase YedYZ heme-binding membrane subunit
VSSQIVWYAARASGIVAWALAASSVVWGLAISSRALGRTPRPAWLFDLHRFLGGTALIFAGVHVGAILLDTYVPFSLVEVLVPFTGSWHPVAVAWGIVALYLLVAVELTSLARARVPQGLWRRVHYGSFGLYVLSTVHALAAGTDGRSPALVAAAVASLAVVGVLSGIRVRRATRRPAPAVAVPRCQPPGRMVSSPGSDHGGSWRSIQASA